VKEIMPWDLSRTLAAGNKPLLLDVREPVEFALLHIPDSINVPRGVLEQSCEWDYDETVPELVAEREREIVVICRSGKRSALAADVIKKWALPMRFRSRRACAGGTITNNRWWMRTEMHWMRLMCCLCRDCVQIKASQNYPDNVHLA
jgi:rhodanese-related sulfurtransferase